MFILNAGGQAIIVHDPSHLADTSNVFEVDTIPEGSGELRTDGINVWWEPTTEPEPVPVNPIEVLQAENKLLKAQLTFEAQRRELVEDCLAEISALVYP